MNSFLLSIWNTHECQWANEMKKNITPDKRLGKKRMLIKFTFGHEHEKY